MSLFNSRKHCAGEKFTLFNVSLFSLVDGEDREGNLSLERSFIPSSSLILLKNMRNVFFSICRQHFDRFIILFLCGINPKGLLGLLHVIV